MEPTQGRSGGGNRPSAARRYSPLIAIIAVIAVVGIIVAVSSGGSDSNSKSDVSTGTGTNAAASGIPKQPWPIFTQANKDSIKWGPNCDTDLGTVKIPYNYASPCAKPFSGDNGGATADGELTTVAAFTAAPEQLWAVQQLTDGSYRITPKSVPGMKEPLALSAVGAGFATLAKFNPASDRQRWNLKGL